MMSRPLPSTLNCTVILTIMMAVLNKLFVLLTVNLRTSPAQNLFKSRSPTALDPFVYTRPYVAPYSKRTLMFALGGRSLTCVDM